MVQTWLQLLVLFIFLIDVVNEICHHGELKREEYDGVLKTIVVVCSLVVYYMGGFFDGLFR